MRENIPSSQQSTESAPGTQADATAPPPGAGVTAEGAGSAAASAQWRRRIGWCGVAALIVFVAAAVVAMFRELQAERALHDVARVAAMPQAGTGAAQAGAGPGPAPAALPAVPTDTGPGAAAATVPAAPGGEVVSALPAAAAAAAGAGVLAAMPQESRAPGAQADNRGPADSQAVPPGSEVVGTALKEGAERAEPGKAAATQDRPAAGKRPLARAKAAGARAEQRKAAGRAASKSRRAEPGAGTFRRCPPLGTKGAVMCRWHICNGGAGKEPACRPYLERKP